MSQGLSPPLRSCPQVGIEFEAAPPEAAGWWAGAAEAGAAAAAVPRPSADFEVANWQVGGRPARQAGGLGLSSGASRLEGSP
jgi:hypothetical protein